MQPRTFRVVVSLAHTASRRGRKTNWWLGGSVSVASKE